MQYIHSRIDIDIASINNLISRYARFDPTVVIRRHLSGHLPVDIEGEDFTSLILSYLIIHLLDHRPCPRQSVLVSARDQASY